MWVLDLCSGLGGASEAFANHPHWEVVRIENNELLADVPHTRLLEVQHWLDWLPGIILEMGGNPDLIVAGPPCLQFSNAYGSPRSIARREGIPYEPNTDLVEDCIEIIEFCQPSYWIIENVAGAVNDFKIHLGRSFCGVNFHISPLTHIGNISKKPEKKEMVVYRFGQQIHYEQTKKQSGQLKLAKDCWMQS